MFPLLSEVVESVCEKYIPSTINFSTVCFELPGKIGPQSLQKFEDIPFFQSFIYIPFKELILLKVPPFPY